jgi:hypothetical protein
MVMVMLMIICWVEHCDRAVLRTLNTGLVGSNPNAGIDVCPRLTVLWCPVYVEVSQLVESFNPPQSKESYQSLEQFYKVWFWVIWSSKYKEQYGGGG